MADEKKPCTSPEARQFDFWVGEWDLAWGEDKKGSNSISLEYGGCVIQEKFNGSPGANFKGMSISVYNERIDKWQQSWGDDQGSYFALVGEFKDGEMVLIHEQPTGEGLNRMRFYNIEENSLDWSWEGSKDDGETWNMLWQIHYERKK